MISQKDVAATAISDLAARLRHIARGRASIDVACFQFIGLDAIQAAYGEKWPAQRAKVHAIAYDFIRKRINPDDILFHGPDGFLMVSASLLGRDAEVAALSLTQSLNSFFLGAVEGGPSASVKVTLETMDVAAFVGTFTAAETPAASRPPVTMTSAPANSVDWKFQPVWDARREALTSYYAVSYKSGTAERIPGYQFEPDQGRNYVFSDIDEHALKLSEIAIKQLFAEGKKALVGVSVHVSSLTNAVTRARLLSIMASFDQELIKYRTLKIAGIPPGFPRLYMSDFIGSAKMRMPNIVLGLAWNENDVATLIQGGIRGVGFALPWSVVNTSPVVPQTEVLARVRAAADIAHAAKIPFFVEGPLTADYVANLRTAGADTIASPLVWQAVAQPRGVQAWSATRLG